MNPTSFDWPAPAPPSPAVSTAFVVGAASLALVVMLRGPRPGRAAGVTASLATAAAAAYLAALPAAAWPITHTTGLAVGRAGCWALAAWAALRTLCGSVRLAQRSPAGDDDAPLLTFDVDVITRADVLNGGVLTVGTVGRGKTSGPQANLELALLRDALEPGVLWLCVKADEARRAYAQARRAGRLDRFVDFSPESGTTFDWAAAVFRHSGGSVPTLSECLRVLGQLHTRSAGHGDEPQWEQQAAQLRQMAVSALSLARAAVSLRNIVKVCQTAPVSAEHLTTESWKHSFCREVLAAAAERLADGGLTPAEAALYGEVETYFIFYFSSLGERYAGSVLGVACAPMFALLAPPCGPVFGGGSSTLDLDALNDGAVLCVNFPLMRLHATGLLAVKAVEMAVDLMALNRPYGSRPIVKVRDELPQFFVGDWDAKVALVQRQSGLACLDVAQTLPDLMAGVPGPNAEKVVHSFAAQHSLFFAAGCAEVATTGRFVAEMLGQEVEFLPNVHGAAHEPPPSPDASLDSVLGTGRTQVGMSASRYWAFPPEKINDPTLRSGGPRNDYRVDCHAIVPARAFRSTGRSVRRVTFRQVLGG